MQALPRKSVLRILSIAVALGLPFASASQFEGYAGQLMRSEPTEEGNFTVPQLPATDNEITMCYTAGSATKSTGKSPYWKDTDARADDFKKVQGTRPMRWSTCLALAKKQCLIATAVLWGEGGKTCKCLYGDVNPTGKGKKSDYVCKFKKSYVSNKLCKDGYFMTGEAKHRQSHYKHKELTKTSSSAACAKEAKKKNCDAAEMPRGSTGTCTCLNLLSEYKSETITLNSAKKTHGTCILNAV